MQWNLQIPSDVFTEKREGRVEGWWYKVLAVRRFPTYYISKSSGISVVVRQEAICESPTVGQERIGRLSGTERWTLLVSEGAFRVTKRRERSRTRKIEDRGLCAGGQVGGRGKHLLPNTNLSEGVGDVRRGNGNRLFVRESLLINAPQWEFRLSGYCLCKTCPNLNFAVRICDDCVADRLNHGKQS